MIKLELQGQQYDFPQSWEEVSYEKFIQLTQNDELNYMYKNIIDVSILSGIPQELLENLPLQEFLKFNIAWMAEFPKLDIKNEWVINGEQYMVHSFDDMNTRSYFDATHFAKDVKTFDKMLAIIFRPISEEKYNPKLVNKRAELLKKELNALEVQKIIGFFLTGTGGLLNNLMTYLPQIEIVTKQMMEVGDFSD